MLADRTACLEGGAVADVVIHTAEYVRLAGHYGFAPDFCHAEDSESKGIVENLYGCAQRDLAVPLLAEAAIAGTPVHLRPANTAAKFGAWRPILPSTRRSAQCVMYGSLSNASCRGPYYLYDFTSGRRRCCASSTDWRVSGTPRPASR